MYYSSRGAVLSHSSQSCVVNDKLHNTRERAYQLLANRNSEILEETTFTNVEQVLSSQQSNTLLRTPMESSFLNCVIGRCACGDWPILDENLLDFLRQVCTFGLPLVWVDFRQESARNTDVMDVITKHLKIGSYREWSEERRQEWLLTELSGKCLLFGHNLPKTEEIADVLETFFVIWKLPSDNFGAYNISMEKSMFDVLAVELLQHECHGKQPFKICPLFTLISSLLLLRSNDFSIWLQKPINGKQEVMIGYSDA